MHCLVIVVLVLPILLLMDQFQFLSFYCKIKARRRKIVRTKIVQHAIFFPGVYFHMFWLIIERDNIVIQLFYTVALTRINLQGSTLGVISDPIKKSFKQKLLKIKFSTKKSARAYFYLPQGWSYGASKSLNSQILKQCKYFECPSSAPMGDRDMLSLTFQQKI